MSDAPGAPAARTFTHGVVASPHYLASAAGHAVLAAGGNAIDAAVATNLVLAVVAPYFCGVGGDLLAMVHDGSQVHAYRSTGRAPATATVDGVRTRSQSDVMPVFGPHAVSVPGAVAGWFELLERWGTRSFGDLAHTALAYAEEGFVVSGRGGDFFAGCRALYPGFEPLQAAIAGAVPGATFRQPALARTLRTLADDGPDAFYRGPIGAAVVETLEAAGGFMTADDLAAHRSAWVEPLTGSYLGATVLEMPPPTQGLTALEAMAIADGFDLGVDSAARQHLLIEAVKAALADRDEHLGDPDWMRVDPASLWGAEHVAQRRAAISPQRSARHPSRAQADGGTAYFCAADRDGLLVSMIQSNFTAIGSGLHVGEWGINLHNRASAFRLEEGHPNSYGPGRIPLHTLVPALAFSDGSPWLVFGTMGGHGQAQTHLQLLTRMRADGLDPQAAISAPRWEVNPDSWRLSAEARFAPDWIEHWRGVGHRVRVARDFDDAMGHAHAIELVPGGMRAGSDPRADGAAIGW